MSEDLRTDWMGEVLESDTQDVQRALSLMQMHMVKG